MAVLTRLYDNHADATHVVDALQAAGIPHSDISLVSNDSEGQHGAATTGSGTGLTSGDPEQGASTGAGTGTGQGAGGGLGAVPEDRPVSYRSEDPEWEERADAERAARLEETLARLEDAHVRN